MPSEANKWKKTPTVIFWKKIIFQLKSLSSDAQDR